MSLERHGFTRGKLFCDRIKPPLFYREFRFTRGVNAWGRGANGLSLPRNVCRLPYSISVRDCGVYGGGASLSQQEVATAVGVTKGMVSKVETGRSIPTLPLLFRYLAALECPVAEFFQDFGPAPAPPYVHQRAEDAEPIERELASRGFDYLQLLAGEGRDFALRAVLLTIEPGSRRDKVTTDAYEFKYVLAGHLDYEIGDTVLRLQPRR